jgi:adenosylcobinamide-GDP ribazoletransferase
MLRSLILAVRFLTVVPIPGPEARGGTALGRAAWWFPVVGLLLGAALAGIDRLLAHVLPPPLAAGLVLSLWKVATGGIHLDGLADCLDGLGGRDLEHRRSIMRDSRIGTFGAIGVVLDVLLAFLALSALPAGARGRVLLLAPALGRLVPLLVGSRFRAATPGRGAGAAFVTALSRWAGPANLVAVSVLAAWLLGAWGVVVTGGALATVCLASAGLATRFGGVTGDVLGAGVEVGELTVLFEAAALAHRGLI